MRQGIHPEDNQHIEHAHCSLERINRSEVGFEDETQRPEPIVRWDPEEIDTFADEAREVIAKGADLGAFIATKAQAKLGEIRDEIVTWFLTQILDAKRPKMRAVVIGLAVGCSATGIKSHAQWARELKVTKQAMTIAVAAFRRKNGIGRIRQLRSNNGRENMRRAYKARIIKRKRRIKRHAKRR